MTKTNAMRMLDKAKIAYKPIEYTVNDNDLSGVTIAKSIGLDCSMVFKTLVAKGDKTGPVVMCIPVDKEIDLKKAASATGNKKIEMVHVKDLLGLTGYIRGGCSPIGMKKKFPTFLDSSCLNKEEITVSAGIKGCQLLLNREELVGFTEATLCDLVKGSV
ncbi:MAG: Cys-tRNA(Pro) deacylase [Clostridia bacterium]|nr:Cys-tRNA(Pro) deacylase [Clostridia bacterium]